MEKRYVVSKEWCDEIDPYYPQLWTAIPAAVCETQERAEKLVEDFQQGDADRFMDWLDECKEYINCGMTDVDSYYDNDRADLYSITEVPYVQ